MINQCQQSLKDKATTVYATGGLTKTDMFYTFDEPNQNTTLKGL